MALFGAANPQDRATDPLKCQREAEVAEMVLGDDLDQAGGCFQEATFLADHTCGKLKALKHLLQVWHNKQDKVGSLIRLRAISQASCFPSQALKHLLQFWLDKRDKV